MAKKRWSGRAKLSVKRYNAYKKAHKARVEALRRKGLEPYYNASTGEDGSIPLTYREYVEIYAEEMILELMFPKDLLSPNSISLTLSFLSSA